MDDFVKILLGLLFVGFSIYNSSRKKKAKISELTQKKDTAEKDLENTSETNYKAKPQINYENTENDLSFFDIIRNEVIDYEKNTPTKTIIEEKNTEPVEEEINETIGVEFNDNKKHTGLTIDENDFIDFDETNEKDETKKIDFDLEKAVIYSEILKPKYF